MRLQVVGNTQILSVSTLDFMKVIPKVCRDNNKSWGDRTKDAFRGLNDETAAQWHTAGVQIHSGVVQGKAMIIMPPGYLTFTKTTSDCEVAGFRRSFLPNTESAENTCKQLAELFPGN